MQAEDYVTMDDGGGWAAQRRKASRRPAGGVAPACGTFVWRGIRSLHCLSIALRKAGPRHEEDQSTEVVDERTRRAVATVATRVGAARTRTETGRKTVGENGRTR